MVDEVGARFACSAGVPFGVKDPAGWGADGIGSDEMAAGVVPFIERGREGSGAWLSVWSWSGAEALGGIEQSVDRFSVEFVAEGGGVQVLEIFLPSELACGDPFGDFLGEVEIGQAIMGCDLFVVEDDVGAFARFDCFDLFWVNEVEQEDVCGWIGLERVPHNPFHGADLFGWGVTVCAVIDCGLQDEEVEGTFGSDIAIEPEGVRG